ncbi:hypothetical protein LPU83_pLPU83c_0516 (plasmid) [Rhizobium favelukesii]|uniref:Uncharacterized protein n=1 Tax=Rhizobium favelukesii TaxID=348824 RepID=W6RQE3_9HYPH|nr:hypothetical protein LPU83_pLPU83c_0516 [Rhizobium favelukesii]
MPAYHPAANEHEQPGMTGREGKPLQDFNHRNHFINRVTTRTTSLFDQEGVHCEK